MQYTAKFTSIDAIKAGDFYFFIPPGAVDPVKIPAAAFEAMYETPKNPQG